MLQILEDGYVTDPADGARKPKFLVDGQTSAISVVERSKIDVMCTQEAALYHCHQNIVSLDYPKSSQSFMDAVESMAYPNSVVEAQGNLSIGFDSNLTH